MCGAAVVALVVGLLVGVAVVPGGRAEAGGGGTPYGVYATAYSSEQALTLGNLGGGHSTVISGGQVTVTGINSTATIGVATTYSDYPGGTVAAQMFSVPGNNSLGAITGIAPVGYAMDPVNANVVYAVDRGGLVYSLNLSGASFKTIANLNPSGASFTANSIAATPDSNSVVVGGITNSFGFVDSVSTNSGAVTQWSGSLRDYSVVDLAMAPDGSTVYASANFTLSPTADLVFALPFPFNPKSPVTWGDSSGNGKVAMSFPASLTVDRGKQTVYLAGLDANGQSVLQTFSASNGASINSVVLPYNPSSNGSGGFNGGVASICLSPDGGTLLALGGTYSSNGTFVSVSTVVYPVSTPGLLVGSPSGSLGSSDPLGNHDIVITPDQAPMAGLMSVSGTAGSPVHFDASSSTVAYGTIANYAWDFGDGSSANTPGPTVTHTFGAQGTYTVKVTEIDSAGVSVPPAPSAPGAVNGPGTTAYLNASPSASLSEQVPVSKKGTPPPPPPTTTTTLKKHGTTTTTLPGTPTLTLSRSVGPPGTIVNASGHGFPPNRNVTVSWSTNNGSYTEMTDAHGNLPSHVFYILTPDILGPRQAVATTTGVPAAKADFLVVIRTSEPGRSLGAAFFRAEGE